MVHIKRFRGTRDIYFYRDMYLLVFGSVFFYLWLIVCRPILLILALLLLVNALHLGVNTVGDGSVGLEAPGGTLNVGRDGAKVGRRASTCSGVDLAVDLQQAERNHQGHKAVLEVINATLEIGVNVGEEMLSKRFVKNSINDNTHHRNPGRHVYFLLKIFEYFFEIILR